MKSLKISKEISLPVEIVTNTIAILAKRRAGKSYAMRKLTEELLGAGQQVISIDPKGDQWGLRSSADGKSPGFPIVILGGEHGDAPLEVNAGEVVAKLVVEERVSVLIDLSTFRKHEIATFMAIFLENLYRLKAQEKYRTPVMLVIDEADAIAPQKPQKGEERMLGAAEDIVRRGGQRGIGCALVTQRSAVLNKNVLTQAQMLIVLRTIAPQDLAAMKAWIDVHGSIEEGKMLMDSLPSLPIGDAWFWSPGWPTAEGIFRRSHVLPITTFDSAATPDPGTKQVIPKNLADVDLEALKKQMSATIEKAKNENPTILQRRILELEKDLATKTAPIKQVISTKIEKIEVPAIGKRALEGFKKSESLVRKMLKEARIVLVSTETLFQETEKACDKISKQIALVVSASPVVSQGGRLVEKWQHAEITSPKKQSESVLTHNDSEITGPEQRILDGLAWCESINMKQVPNELVAFLAGYAHCRSTGYTNPRGALRGRNLIEYDAQKVFLTPSGRASARARTSPLTQEELHKSVLERLDGPQQRILKPLLKAYPYSISNQELAAAADYAHERSTGYTNPRGSLRSYGLIEYSIEGVRAKDLLFIS